MRSTSLGNLAVMTIAAIVIESFYDTHVQTVKCKSDKYRKKSIISTITNINEPMENKII